MESVIRLDRLVKAYGPRRGVVDLSLEVHAGEVFGYLGPNGAGKSTTIRLLVDLIRPTGGSIRVLGGDPRAGGTVLRARIGYLPGDFVVGARQRVGEYLTFLAGLRGGAGQARIGELAERLDLDLTARVGTLSKGNRQKVGLVQAFMHEPDLLILDEPTSGLDPVVQQTFLSMVAEAKAAGQTVFMSSHILSEVEQVADRVAIIRDGALVTVDSVVNLRARAVRRVQVTFATPVPVSEFAGLPGVDSVTVDGPVLRCRVTGSPDALIKTAAQHSIVDLLSDEPALEELFLAYYEGRDHVAA
ncbi:ABC transporter ATP-binding protein [Actinocrispum wychmicini]|uniref:ABC-2 type transport system ATP-binding protein n=1 Tax=Actinocrispum wychmicini TaxID=1213861 RepID=A0A4R2JF23_9PSEU|nr:ABC transporter ATP-binding protein [Actinocrispum wychmicini]TCO58313.1 ABC-2 type transport system ATP-binding protein [Actinocrispum wychmicini]